MREHVTEPTERTARTEFGDGQLYDHPMGVDELAAVEARLNGPVSLFAVHAHSAVARLAREVRRLRLVTALSARDHADLVDAARHALAADDAGEQDPLFWVRDELRSRGLWPAPRRGPRRTRPRGVAA